MYEGLIKLASTAYLDNKSRSSLHKILGYSEEQRIPQSVFESILKTPSGKKVGNVVVTEALKDDVRKALDSRTTAPRAGAGRKLGLGPYRATAPGLGRGRLIRGR